MAAEETRSEETGAGGTGAKDEEMRPEKAIRRAGIAVYAAVALVAAALVWYACTAAFAWDEGYHLVAAWLIAHGKRPYIDFLFPQTPLNAYWNALLLRLVGEYWRVPHIFAALLTVGAVALSAGYVYRRLPAPPSWRAPAAIMTAVTMGLNTAVFEFGSLQAYGMCLFLIVAAWRVAISAVDRPGVWRPAVTGLLSGAAAASSLLTAPVAPVLLVWMIVVNRSGSRAKKFAGFAGGVLAAFLPLLRLMIEAPHPVIFGFLQYELIYRKVEWDGAFIHNLGEVLGWADSSQAVLLVLLAALGLLLIRSAPAARIRGPRTEDGVHGQVSVAGELPESSVWNRALKAEFYLCGWLALTMTAFLLTARPTFSRYFLLTVPFLAILAVAGLYELAERLSQPGRPWLASGVLCIVTAYGLGASLFEQRSDFAWSDAEAAAAKVREVTPASASLLADEPVYFLLHRVPPSGMELEDSHKLPLSDAEAAALHVVPRPKLDLMVKAGRFDTVEMCDDDEVDRLDLSSLYSKSASAGDCQIFWNRGSTPAK